jgi:hypothetical protein
VHGTLVTLTPPAEAEQDIQMGTRLTPHALLLLGSGGRFNISYMLKKKPAGFRCLMLLGTFLAVSFVGSRGHSPQGARPPAPGAGKPAVAGPPYRNQPAHFDRRARMYYEMVWGVDSLSVKLVESGEIIRFSYRVVDPERAKVLNDKKVDPVLISPERGLKLVVPTMEKVGQLRQSAPPEAGKSYWMAFSNSGRLIKKGDRVNVVIGNFHADGLELQ